MQIAPSMKSPIVFLLIPLTVMYGGIGVQAADAEQPRLKYRSKGPVCSCSSGLGEETIRKAWEARFVQPEAARPAQVDESLETRVQQKEKAR